mgnify:CR=1 FL=1
MPIEKIDLPPRFEEVKREDGTTEIKTIPRWEIKASGKEVQELKGIFKDSAPQMMHEGLAEFKRIGGTRVSLPNGSTDVVRSDMVEKYRGMPGFCVNATRPTFTFDGFGGMKAAGLTRMRIRYHNGQREVLEAR